jgi:hypothetical protein
MPENIVDESGNTIKSIMFITVLLGVMILAIAVTLGALSNANTDLNGAVNQTISVINETGYANSTGYTLSYTSVPTASTPVLTALFNRTSGAVIGLGNATVSSLGVVKNASVVVWNNLSISYTYVKETTSATTDAGIDDVQDSVLSMAANFFALMPTVGTILAVVVLIGGIAILIFYVLKMRKPQEESIGFNG